jgi:hypothetical protein
MNVAELFTAVTIGALLAGIASLDLSSAQQDIDAVGVAMAGLELAEQVRVTEQARMIEPLACR